MNGQMLSTVSEARGRIGEHGFPTLAAMLEDANGQRARSQELRVPARAVFFHPDGVDLGAGVTAGGFTDWAKRQAGTLCGVPARVQDKLTAPTLARVLNETFPRDDARSFLLESPEGGEGLPTVRSITSTGYRRVWDGELLGEVARWLEPNGWVPAFPERNVHGPEEDRERALWRSDRESFAFFMSERDMDRGGPADWDGLGGMRRGLWIGNSETGARSLSWGTFWFRALCCNFLVWSAEEVATRRRRHTAGVVREVGALRSWIRDAVPVTVAADLDPFRVVAASAFPVAKPERKGKGRGSRLERPEETLGRTLATRYGVTLATGKRAAALALAGDEGARPGTWWAVVNGLTAAAREETAGGRLELGQVAGKVMQDALAAV